MNTDTFIPENKTISQIFNCDQIYRIPDYQRQYSWSNEQLEELWDDLYEAYENVDNNKCYFLGSIVVVKNGDYLDLVDGQQRLTTLMIMMDVLRKNFPNLNEDSEEINFVDLDKINKCILHSGKRSRLQLQSDPNYNALFNNKIIKRENYDKLTEPTKKEMKQDNPEYKYLNTAYFFYNKFKSLKREVLNDFVNYIFFKANIIRIICNDESFAIKLFQVLNDTGLDLSNSDLVKAHILSKYDSDDIEEKKSFNVEWNKIVTIANNNDFTMDEFIVYYEYFKLKSNPKKQVLDEIKMLVKNDYAKDIIEEMTEFANKVNFVCNSTDKRILALRYIPWKAYVMTALASAYYVDYPEIDDLLDSMRRFFYISFISGGTLNTIKNTSFKLIEYIIDKKQVDEINRELNSLIKNKRMIKSVYEALDGEVYDEKFLKPLLLSVDYDIREEGITTFYKIDKDLHMDHILPRAYKKERNHEWDYIENKEEADMYLNTLGNMALLRYNKNEECENFGFAKKIKIYQGENSEGENKSGETAFVTTKVIIKNALKDAKKRMKENKTDKPEYIWNVDSIKLRKTYLLGLIEDMLDITRDDIELNVLVDNEPTGNQRWLYKGNYYNNKEVIFETLKDYIESNDYKSYLELPEELRIVKMHSHELIKEALSQNDIDMGYSYKEVIMNGFKLYIRDHSDTTDTNKYINLLSKYFNFEIEYMGENRDERRSTITEELVKKSYEISKKVYSGEVTKQKAINELVENGMNAGSAHIYITCFIKMMQGDVYKRYPTRFATEYFILNIKKDYGDEAYKKAISAFEKNIEYLTNVSKASRTYIELLEQLKNELS